MPKPGYSIIIVSDSVKRRLESVARSRGFRTVNQLLESWLRVNPRVYPNGGEKNLNSGLFLRKIGGGSQVWSKAQGLGPCGVALRGFKSHPPHYSKVTEILIFRIFIK